VPAEPEEGLFEPAFWVRNPNVQSFLASFSLGRAAVERRCAELLHWSRETLLDCGEGVRLLGYRARSPLRQSRGGARQLAIILHGWEGSANSLYVLSMGQYLLARGFDVFRLNLRDHGESHHLNPGIFHSCRLPEVVGAVHALADLFPRHRRVFAGFSLGGNFALRVGASLGERLDVLDRIVAISPVLDPQNTLEALEGGLAFYRRYFIKKWRGSLAIKQSAWPSDYDFSQLERCRTLTQMTEYLVLHHTGYPSLADYLRGYAITGDVLQSLRIRSRIIAAKDDPIIPSRDIARLPPNPALRITLTERGGHCGFRERLLGGAWLHRRVHSEFAPAP
jgi:predicted alpha/beta-fold hydrolase